MSEALRIFPLGDSAITIEFGNDISVELNQRAIALANVIEEHPFPGFTEAVPAYASTTVFYDLTEVRRAFPDASTAFLAVEKLIQAAVAAYTADDDPAQLSVAEIPVHFDAASSPDLEYVAEQSRLSTKEVVDLFTSRVYRVFMLGFLPGFTYMAEVDPLIATPRRQSPRHSVPKGSIGIAGRQTGIYSLESPGGWQIIGRTDADIFTPDAERPAVLNPGDRVRFYPAE